VRDREVGSQAGELAGVLRKHPVVVSRWVVERRQSREGDEKSSAACEALDEALSEEAFERLRKHRRSMTN
jgi:hypothetical protein